MYERLTKDLYCRAGRHTYRAKIRRGREPHSCDRHGRRQLGYTKKRGSRTVGGPKLKMLPLPKGRGFARVKAVATRLLASGKFVTVGITTRTITQRQYGYPSGVKLRGVCKAKLKPGRVLERAVTKSLKGRSRFLGTRGGNGYFGRARRLAATMVTVYVAFSSRRFRCNRD